MLVWLARLAALGFIALALGLTIAAWRARRSTPQTISLVLSTAICAALLLVALDFPVPGVCRGDPPTVRPDALEAELSRWRWWLSPCGRVEVTAVPEDLELPLDLGKLTSMAVEAGVVVDVAFQRGVPAQAPQIELVRLNDPTRSFPLKTPIPGPYTDTVEPRLGAVTPQCSIDDGPSRRGTLAELLGNVHADYYGFHRITCRVSGSEDAAVVSGYLDITKAGVVIAGDDPEKLPAASDVDCSKSFVRYGEFRSAASRAYGLDLAIRTVERCAPPSASMLVLDRPQRPQTCRLAQELLNRGATVVLAMPGDDFFADDCRALRPVDPVTPARNPPSRSTKTILFDRTPRVTFLLDDTLGDLKFAPTCVIQDRHHHTCASSEQWPSSTLKLQLDKAHEACRSLTAEEFLYDASCNRQFAPLAARTDVHEPVLYLRRPSFSPDGDLSRLEHSAPEAGLGDLAAALVTSDARVLWENEVAVVFTHDLRPPTGVDAFVERFGSRVHVVRVQDPYGTSLHTLAPEIPPRQLGAESLLSIPTMPRWAVDPGRCGDDVSRCIASIQSLYTGRAQSAARVTLPEYSRFNHGSVPQTRAPVRFSWYKLPDPQRGGASPVQLAHTTEDAGLTQRPLAVGTMVGRGHLLILSYSPFETVEGRWRDLLDPALPAPAEMRLIEQLYLGTEDILAEMNGPVLSVAIQPDGALWVTVLRDTSATQQLDSLEFRGGGTSEPIRAPLVDFDATGRTLTYALPAAELRDLTRCTPLQADLPRQKGMPDENRPIYACPPVESSAKGQRWDAALALEQLAYYTGGRARRPDDAAPATSLDAPRSRTFSLGMLSGLFLLAWGRRAVRRLAAWRAYRKLRHIDAIAQRRFDPPEAVVAAAGDWDGRTSTWPRTGAFGGYRPLEPGDRSAAIVLHDLVIREQRGTQLLPRVALRIEEAAPSVLVLLNLGESMRVPERADSSKGLFAGRVAAHVAASTWKLRGEAALHAVGIHGDTEIIAPVHLSPGHEEVETNLRARLRQRPARDTKPWPEDLPECGAVVYISDFQVEDERALQEWVTRLEGEGIRVGGIMLYSPFEFTMIEGGRLAASGVWADRADWDPDDLFEAFSRRRDQVERIFDSATTGGLVVVATTFGQDDVELALAGGRLLQILR